MREIDIKEIARELKPKEQVDISDHLRRMCQEYKEEEARKKEEGA